MHFSTFVAATLAFVETAFSAASDTCHIVHEKRHGTPNGWTMRDEVDHQAILPMKIALAQSNLNKAWEWLEGVSSPESERYGMHWSAKDVASAFAPSEESVSAVRTWLASAGIDNLRISQSQSLGFLEFNATVGETQELLRTRYHSYAHDATGKVHMASEEYSIPCSLRRQIDFVSPTVQFAADLKPTHMSDGTAEKPKRTPGLYKGPGRLRAPHSPKPVRRQVEQSQPMNQLNDCDKQMVPNCVRALYRLPPDNTGFVNSKNSFGIVEYSPLSYLASDLDMFFRNFSPQAVGSRPTLDSIDGGVILPSNESISDEPDLDFEYGMTLVYPQQVTLYQVGDNDEAETYNIFLDAIDASYCTFDGGDDPKIDPVFPDPVPGGYKGPLNCGGFAATKVISQSYSLDEQALPPSYLERQCHEYLKLGLMGVSVVVSTGDFGVAGEGNCVNFTDSNIPKGIIRHNGRFVPTFPGSCPYVTGVGATQVKPGTNVPQAIASGTEPEEASETVIRSAGGFSDVFALPSYQKPAVHEYFAKHSPPYAANKYNSTQHSRGIPDVSANGANYIYALRGKFILGYGTSFSAPVFASILTLINAARLEKGMSSLGFINPVAYKFPQMFNDITKGDNPGCATAGFSAEPGWDPVTGLGTPNFPKMLEVFVEQASNWGPGKKKAV